MVSAMRSSAMYLDYSGSRRYAHKHAIAVNQLDILAGKSTNENTVVPLIERALKHYVKTKWLAGFAVDVSNYWTVDFNDYADLLEPADTRIYPRSVTLLEFSVRCAQLADVSIREAALREAAETIAFVRQVHGKRPTLMRLMDEAGLAR